MKGMPKSQPLAFICPDLSDIARYATVTDRAYRIMRSLLPGPYCFILPASREVPRILMMKRRTVGIRVPDSPVALALVRELGNPIVSTSATFEGEQLNDPADIAARFRDVSIILDVGFGGLDPSTVIDITSDEPVVQRVGVGAVDWID